MGTTKRDTISKHRTLLFALFIVLLCVSATLLEQYRYAFHSDDAIKTVLSRLALFDGSLVPKNWVYANGDTFLLSPYIFSIFIYPIFGISYLSNAVASWLAYLCLTLAVYFVTRKIAAGKSRAALIATLISAAGISAANFEFVIAQGAYSMYAAIAVCIYALATPPQPPVSGNNETKPTAIAILSLCGFTAALWASISNPTRGVVTIVLPVMLGWTAFMLFSVRNDDRKALCVPHYKTIISIFVGSVVGYLLYKYLIYPKILNFDAAAKIGMASKSEIFEHLSKMPSAWFEYFQLWGGWTSLSAPLQALQFFVWLIALALILLPIYTIFNSKKHGHSLTCLAWLILASYSVSFSAMAVSPTLFSSALDMRYATFPMYGAVCMLAVYADEFASRHSAYGKAMLACVIVVGISSAQLWRNEYKAHSVSSGNASYTQRASLIKLLEANNVGTILTTYWNSHVLTVLSNGAVDAYPVGIGSQLTPFAHHMPRHIFYGYAGKKQAVVLNGEDSNANTWSAIEYQLGKPYEKISVGPFTAWIYDRDIAETVLQTGSEIDSSIPPGLLEVGLSETNLAPCRSKSGCHYQVDAVNIGRHILSSVGFRPLRLGITGVDSNGAVVIQDVGRADFPTALKPGDSALIRIAIPVSKDTRVSGYRLCLLQEGVNWLCDHTQSQRRRDK